MARMYSRKKGKSGSTWPSQKVAPNWLRYKDDEVEKLVEKLAKDGNSPSMIGLILRDSYGIPSSKIAANKKVTQILEEKKLLSEMPEDIYNLIVKALKIRKHLDMNKKDMPAKRGLQLTESKVRRLAKYYKRVGKLPLSWKYDPKNIRIYIE